MLTAKDLSFTHNEVSILNQIDLKIEKGELLIIIGPNGAGKSTLLQMLANENAACQEDILFKNKKMKDWHPHLLAHHKAKFSQEHNLDIGLLVKDIVMMGRYPYFNSTPQQRDRRVIAEAMNKTDVYELRNREYNSLSGGEKQRVHLARVLAQLENDTDTKMAFFDEPLNNLDVRHQYRILENIREFTTQGNSAVLVLHDLNLAAEFADTVLLLKKGSVVAHGKPETIFQEGTISKAYDFPCAICTNPITQNPMIIFRKGRAKACPLRKKAL